MMGWYNACAGSGYSWGWMFLMIFGLTTLLGIGTWALVRLTRADDEHTGRAVETPRQILDRRLAAGEIDADEYLSARQAIEERTATEAGTTA